MAFKSRNIRLSSAFKSPNVRLSPVFKSRNVRLSTAFKSRNVRLSASFKASNASPRTSLQQTTLRLVFVMLQYQIYTPNVVQLDCKTEVPSIFISVLRQMLGMVDHIRPESLASLQVVS